MISLVFILVQQTGPTIPPYPTPPLLVDGVARDYSLPAALAGAQVTRTLATDWTGDLRPDAALVADGQLCFQHGPDTFRTNLVVPSAVCGSPVLDIEVLPRTGGLPGLLVLSPGALRILTWNPATGAFEHEASFTAGGWSGAQAIRRFDLDGDAQADYVGVNTTRRRLLVLEDLSQSSGIVHPEVPVGALVRSIEPVHWTGTNVYPQEVAVRLDSELRVYAHTGGSPLFSFSSPHPLTSIEPVKLSGSALESVAVFQHATTTGHDWLLLFGAGSSMNALDLGDYGANAARAGDYDLDGDEDLIVCQETTSDLFVLRNDSQGGGAAFTTAGIMIYPGVAATPPSGFTAVPLLHDFDGDGDLDLLAAMPGGTLRMQRSLAVHETDLWPLLSPVKNHTQLNGSTLTFKLLAPTGTSLLVPDGMEIELWHQANAEVPLVDAAPVLSNSFVLASGYSSWDSPGITLGQPETVYHILAREVQHGPDGSVIAAGPTATYFYTSDPNVYVELYAGAPALLQALVPSNVPGTAQAAVTGGGGPSSGPPPPAQ